MTDTELVARALAGAQDAWTELVHRHQGAVYRAAHAALMHREEAEEAAQDAWISAWQHLAGFRGHASFRTWLLSIAWRKALDRRRGLVAWVRAYRLDRHADEEGPPMELVEHRSSSETQLIDRERQERIRRLVKALPRSLRDALLLVSTRDVAYDEAAALLGIPVGTLKWRVSEARRRLRERLAVPGVGTMQEGSGRAPTR